MKNEVTEWSVRASGGANAVSTATKAASTQLGVNHYVTWVFVSSNGQPAAAVVALVRENASTTRYEFQIPAAAFSNVHVNFAFPLRITENTSVDITCPALGAGVTSSVVIGGYSR